MKSTKCPACGFVGFLNAGTCKGCGKPVVEQSYAFTPATSYSDNSYYQSESSEGAKQGLAVFALVLGIISFLTFGLLGVGAVAGIIVSVIAMNRVKEDPWQYGGRGLAIAGLVLSIVSLVSAVPIGIIAAIAIPNFYAARMAANEGSELSCLRTLHRAEATHQSMFGRFASLEELGAKNLVDSQLAAGTKNGYRFTVEVTPMQYPSPDGFEVVAMPLTYQDTGRRSFFVDETGVISAADNRGCVL
jgi:hypothetical protein